MEWKILLNPTSWRGSSPPGPVALRNLGLALDGPPLAQSALAERLQAGLRARWAREDAPSAEEKAAWEIQLALAQPVVQTYTEKTRVVRQPVSQAAPVSCLSFNSGTTTASKVTVPGSKSWDLGRDFSVEFMCRPTRVDADVKWSIILTKATQDKTKGLNVFQVGADLYCDCFRIVGGAKPRTWRVSAAGVLAAGTWVHVALVRDATNQNLQLYINGRLVKSQGANLQAGESLELNANISDLTLGNVGNQLNSTPFQGELCELRLWGRARSGDEVARDCTVRLGDAATGQEALTGYWPLGKPEAAELVKDLGPAQRHGTAASVRALEDGPALTETVMRDVTESYLVPDPLPARPQPVVFDPDAALIALVDPTLCAEPLADESIEGLRLRRTSALAEERARLAAAASLISSTPVLARVLTAAGLGLDTTGKRGVALPHALDPRRVLAALHADDERWREAGLRRDELRWLVDLVARVEAGGALLPDDLADLLDLLLGRFRRAAALSWRAEERDLGIVALSPDLFAEAEADLEARLAALRRWELDADALIDREMKLAARRVELDASAARLSAAQEAAEGVLAVALRRAWIDALRSQGDARALGRQLWVDLEERGDDHTTPLEQAVLRLGALVRALCEVRDAPLQQPLKPAALPVLSPVVGARAPALGRWLGTYEAWTGERAASLYPERLLGLSLRPDATDALGAVMEGLERDPGADPLILAREAFAEVVGGTIDDLRLVEAPLAGWTGQTATRDSTIGLYLFGRSEGRLKWRRTEGWDDSGQARLEDWKTLDTGEGQVTRVGGATFVDPSGGTRDHTVIVVVERLVDALRSLQLWRYEIARDAWESVELPLPEGVAATSSAWRCWLAQDIALRAPANLLIETWDTSGGGLLYHAAVWPGPGAGTSPDWQIACGDRPAPLVAAVMEGAAMVVFARDANGGYTYARRLLDLSEPRWIRELPDAGPVPAVGAIYETTGKGGFSQVAALYPGKDAQGRAALHRVRPPAPKWTRGSITRIPQLAPADWGLKAQDFGLNVSDKVLGAIRSMSGLPVSELTSVRLGVGSQEAEIGQVHAEARDALNAVVMAYSDRRAQPLLAFPPALEDANTKASALLIEMDRLSDLTIGTGDVFLATMTVRHWGAWLYQALKAVKLALDPMNGDGVSGTAEKLQDKLHEVMAEVEQIVERYMTDLEQCLADHVLADPRMRFAQRQLLSATQYTLFNLANNLSWPADPGAPFSVALDLDDTEERRPWSPPQILPMGAEVSAAHTAGPCWDPSKRYLVLQTGASWLVRMGADQLQTARSLGLPSRSSPYAAGAQLDVASLSERRAADLGASFGEVLLTQETQTRTPVGIDPRSIEDAYIYLPFAVASWLVRQGRHEEALPWYRRVWDERTGVALWSAAPLSGESADPGAAPTSEAALNGAPLPDPWTSALSRQGTVARAVRLGLAGSLFALGDRAYALDTAEHVARAAERYRGALAALWPEQDLDLLVGQITLAPGSALGRCPQELSPPPELAALLGRIQGRLRQIHEGRNLGGLRRELDGYVASSEATGLAGVTAAWRQPPTIWRWRTLLSRAKELAEQARAVEGALMSAIQAGDASALEILRSQQDIATQRALLRLRDEGVTQAERGVAVARAQQARGRIQLQEMRRRIAAGMNDHERSMLRAQRSASEFRRASSRVASAISSYDYAGRALGEQSIVEFFDSFGSNLGAAANFSIAAGLSLTRGELDDQALSSEAEAHTASFYASHERRVEEWQLAAALGEADLSVGALQIDIARGQVGLARAERRLTALSASHTEAIARFLADRQLSPALFRFVAGQLRSALATWLDAAVSTARLAEAALAFERLEAPGRFIALDYGAPNRAAGVDDHWTAATRLLTDLARLEQHALLDERRRAQLTRTFSLAQLDPAALDQLRERGSALIELPMALFDQDFPGHVQRRIRRVRLSVLALIPPGEGIKATLSAPGSSWVVPGFGVHDPVALIAPDEPVALCSPVNATGLFELEPASDQRFPFEGRGVAGTFHLHLPKPANRFDYQSLFDVSLTLDYTALDDPEHRERTLARLGRRVSLRRGFSVRDDFPDLWYDLLAATGPFEGGFVVRRADFPPNLESLTLVGEASVARADTLVGAGVTVRAPASGAPVGRWTLRVDEPAELREAARADPTLDLLLTLVAVGRTPPWGF